MNFAENQYQSPIDVFAAQAAADERSDFITKTYLHLAGAIALFVVLEVALFQLNVAESLARMMLGYGNIGWLVVLGLFMIVSHIANNWALSAVNLPKQYMGLGLYVVAEAVIFVPLLFIAGTFDPGIIPTAAVTTLALFAVLTAVVFVTRKDFSFLRTVLVFGGFAALGLIVVALLFNFNLGPIFTYAMIALACGYILYYTSNVMLHYRTSQYVAASLALFAAVALLFWYIIQLFLSRRN